MKESLLAIFPTSSSTIASAHLLADWAFWPVITLLWLTTWHVNGSPLLNSALISTSFDSSLKFMMSHVSSLNIISCSSLVNAVTFLDSKSLGSVEAFSVIGSKPHVPWLTAPVTEMSLYSKYIASLGGLKRLSPLP